MVVVVVTATAGSACLQRPIVRVSVLLLRVRMWVSRQRVLLQVMCLLLLHVSLCKGLLLLLCL